MVATELLAFVRANLPAPPMRLLEIGAGDGALARALADTGCEVLAIDPEPAARTCTRSSASFAALEPYFHVGTPLYGPYLYRWDLDEALRHHEEDAIARAEIPAVGARLLAQRHP